MVKLDKDQLIKTLITSSLLFAINHYCGFFRGVSSFIYLIKKFCVLVVCLALWEEWGEHTQCPQPGADHCPPGTYSLAKETDLINPQQPQAFQFRVCL